VFAFFIINPVKSTNRAYIVIIALRSFSAQATERHDCAPAFEGRAFMSQPQSIAPAVAPSRVDPVAPPPWSWHTLAAPTVVIPLALAMAILLYGLYLRGEFLGYLPF
jgi:hypothetical protein